MKRQEIIATLTAHRDELRGQIGGQIGDTILISTESRHVQQSDKEGWGK